MLAYSRSELQRYFGKSGIKYFFKAWFIPGYRYMFYFRLAEKRKGILRLLGRLFLRRYSFKYGFQIPYNTKIGKGFYIGHFGSIVINNNAVIGENCNVSPGVVIGRTNRGKTKGSPTIGNSVWIGSNSVIVGGIKIGNDVLIAPGAYINFDIPDNSIAIGNPARVIPKEDATQGYINFKV